MHVLNFNNEVAHTPFWRKCSLWITYILRYPISNCITIVKRKLFFSIELQLYTNITSCILSTWRFYSKPVHWNCSDRLFLMLVVIFIFRASFFELQAFFNRSVHFVWKMYSCENNRVNFKYIYFFSYFRPCFERGWFNLQIISPQRRHPPAQSDVAHWRIVYHSVTMDFISLVVVGSSKLTKRGSHLLDLLVNRYLNYTRVYLLRIFVKDNFFLIKY